MPPAIPARFKGSRLEAVSSTHATVPGFQKVAAETAIWQETLTPFFFETEVAPLAASLDGEVVRDLAGAKISSEVCKYAREAVRHHRVIYLDIGSRALLFGDALQVCALFITATTAGVRFLAVFSEPGRRDVRRVSWLEGDDSLLTDQFHDEDVMKLWADMGFEGRLPSRRLAEVARDTGVDLKEVLQDLEDFAYLATTYALTEMEAADGRAWEMLPHLPAGHERRLSRKSAATAKKFSLFRVWRLTARRLDRGQQVGSSEGWKLGRRVKVSGHYRLQPCGPKWSQRRLRWIAQHERGPLDRTPLTPIVRVGLFPHRENAM